jgi:hypothetical protein
MRQLRPAVTPTTSISTDPSHNRYRSAIDAGSRKTVIGGLQNPDGHLGDGLRGQRIHLLDRDPAAGRAERDDGVLAVITSSFR